MNSELEQLLKDFDIPIPEDINEMTLYDVINKLAEKWNILKKDTENLDVNIFNSLCPNAKDKICCCDCSDRFFDCKHSCFTYKFDCDGCTRRYSEE